MPLGLKVEMCVEFAVILHYHKACSMGISIHFYKTSNQWVENGGGGGWGRHWEKETGRQAIIYMRRLVLCESSSVQWEIFPIIHCCRAIECASSTYHKVMQTYNKTFKTSITTYTANTITVNVIKTWYRVPPSAALLTLETKRGESLKVYRNALCGQG